jgi:hypothetical protein
MLHFLLLVFSMRVVLGFIPALARLAARLTQLAIGSLRRLAGVLRDPVSKLSGLTRRGMFVLVVIAGTSNRSDQKKSQKNCEPDAHSAHIG